MGGAGGGGQGEYLKAWRFESVGCGQGIKNGGRKCPQLGAVGLEAGEGQFGLLPRGWEPFEVKGLIWPPSAPPSPGRLLSKYLIKLK